MPCSPADMTNIGTVEPISSMRPLSAQRCCSVGTSSCQAGSAGPPVERAGAIGGPVDNRPQGQASTSSRKTRIRSLAQAPRGRRRRTPHSTIASSRDSEYVDTRRIRTVSSESARARASLLVLFLLGILLPLIDWRFGLDQTQELAESRTAAPAPVWPTDLAQWQALPKALDSYWNDAFGFRHTLLRWQAIASYDLGVSPTPNVIIGKCRGCSSPATNPSSSAADCTRFRQPNWTPGRSNWRPGERGFCGRALAACSWSCLTSTPSIRTRSPSVTAPWRGRRWTS